MSAADVNVAATVGVSVATPGMDLSSRLLPMHAMLFRAINNDRSSFHLCRVGISAARSDTVYAFARVVEATEQMRRCSGS